MLFKNQKRTGNWHFKALTISTKQIFKYVTIFQNFCILFLKQCDITVKNRLVLRTHFASLTPKLCGSMLATSIGKKRIHQLKFQTIGVASIYLHDLGAKIVKCANKTRLYSMVMSHPTCFKNQGQKLWKMEMYFKVSSVLKCRTQKCPKHCVSDFCIISPVFLLKMHL